MNPHITLTKPQRVALHAVYKRVKYFGTARPLASYRAFRRNVAPSSQAGRIVIHAFGVAITIEADGAIDGWYA
jgi:hypothetical protein